MIEFFEIAGMHIRFSDIKNFRIVQREYIYRPVYVETERTSFIDSFFNNSKKYEFKEMEPYAAIVDESKYNSSSKGKSKKDSVTKNVIEGAMTSIGDAFNIKALRDKKYHCVNMAGREFTTYLEDVPVVLMRSDGKVSDITKKDKVYSQLDESIIPSIMMVDALMIETSKETFLFYGDGIHLEDVEVVYKELEYELDDYAAAKKEESKIKLPKFSMPEISIKKPSFRFSKNSDIESSKKKIAEKEI